MIISNSTPLIYLAKLNKLNLVIDIYKKILIPEEVFSEVVLGGKELNKKEVILIEDLISQKVIEVKEVKELKRELNTLHTGEAKAISLCLNEKIKDILIDDKEAYELCKILNLNPIRTTAFLLNCAKNKIISKEEFKENLINLSQEGYFMTADVFQYLLDALNEN